MRNYVLFNLRRIVNIFNGSPQSPDKWIVGETQQEVEFLSTAWKDSIAGVPRNPSWTFTDNDYVHTDIDDLEDDSFAHVRGLINDFAFDEQGVPVGFHGGDPVGIYCLLRKRQVVAMLKLLASLNAFSSIPGAPASYAWDPETAPNGFLSAVDPRGFWSDNQ